MSKKEWLAWQKQVIREEVLDDLKKERKNYQYTSYVKGYKNRKRTGGN